VARIAQDCGIRALAVHGRTREDLFQGEAEYDTIAAIKQAVAIPVLANGDITTPEKARQVLDRTGADGLMIGRGALGRPWIFHEIAHYLAQGTTLPPPSHAEIGATLLQHLDALHRFYGEERGVRVARKHIRWFCRDLPGLSAFWAAVHQVDSAARQRQRVTAFFADMENRLLAAA
jgi:tRNA-dihydrouridine synthase B